MEGFRPPWYVDRSAVSPRFTFFISHVAEDNDDVIRLKAEIAALSGRAGRPSLNCYLDLHDWASGVENSRVIREALAESEHMILWVTKNYLKAAKRGWVWFELAYAELINWSFDVEMVLQPRRTTYPFIIPVFRGVNSARLSRLPLHNYWQEKLATSPADSMSDIAHKIIKFYEINHAIIH